MAAAATRHLSCRAWSTRNPGGKRLWGCSKCYFFSALSSLVSFIFIQEVRLPIIDLPYTIIYPSSHSWWVVVAEITRCRSSRCEDSSRRSLKPPYASVITLSPSNTFPTHSHWPDLTLSDSVPLSLLSPYVNNIIALLMKGIFHLSPLLSRLSSVYSISLQQIFWSRFFILFFPSLSNHSPVLGFRASIMLWTSEITQLYLRT